MREPAARAYFLFSLFLGRLLRAGRYSTVKMVSQGDGSRVQKRRSFYAPLVVWIGGWVIRILDTGVRVLPQREWEERERNLYQALGRSPIRSDGGRTLTLPRLGGRTLATLLDDRTLEAWNRNCAIELAVVALAAFHRMGSTHGDAMAENVLIDLGRGEAHWFDFETVHDPDRPMIWRRADDLRSLLSTCALRTRSDALADTVHLILATYADEEVIPFLSATFNRPTQRALPFHLGQAGLSYERYREIGRILKSLQLRKAADQSPRSAAE